MEVAVTTGLLVSYKSCKAPVKSSPPTNQHPVFYRLDALPIAQPTMSKHWMEKKHIPWTCLTLGHLESSNFVSDHWQLLVTLGEGCLASHQPSDASTRCKTKIWKELLSVDDHKMCHSHSQLHEWRITPLFSSQYSTTNWKGGIRMVNYPGF